MQTSVVVESPGTVGFIVDVVGDFLQVLEVRPGRESGGRAFADSYIQLDLVTKVNFKAIRDSSVIVL